MSKIKVGITHEIVAVPMTNFSKKRMAAVVAQLENEGFTVKVTKKVVVIRRHE